MNSSRRSLRGWRWTAWCSHWRSPCLFWPSAYSSSAVRLPAEAAVEVAAAAAATRPIRCVDSVTRFSTPNSPDKFTYHVPVSKAFSGAVVYQRQPMIYGQQPVTYMYPANQPQMQPTVIGQAPYPQAPAMATQGYPSAGLPPYTESSTMTSQSLQTLPHTEGEGDTESISVEVMIVCPVCN